MFKTFLLNFSNSSLSFASFFTILDAWVLPILNSSFLKLSFLFFSSSNILNFTSNVRHRFCFFWVDERHVNVNIFVCRWKQFCDQWLWNRTKTFGFRKFKLKKFEFFSFEMTFITLLFWVILETVFNMTNLLETIILIWKSGILL